MHREAVLLPLSQALAQVEEHQGRLSQLEQLRAEEALLARVRQLESCVLAAQVKQEEERAAAQARQEADRAAAEAHVSERGEGVWIPTLMAHPSLFRPERSL